MKRKTVGFASAIGRNAFRLFILALLLTVSSGVLFAQSDLGTISGFVKDQSNAVIANAKITLTNESGVERSANTNESGYYSVTNLPPGLYSVKADAPGFQQFESDSNKLDSSANLLVNATLTIGASSQKITVSATAEALQTESASVQQLVTRSQVDALELNGRNPIFMANLVPGTRGGTLAGLSFNFSQGPS
ncbi:MAG: carboxypeptidase-like regulatory domain-containing protein, partial [Candidatus Acidiferrales bacterium]